MYKKIIFGIIVVAVSIFFILQVFKTENTEVKKTLESIEVSKKNVQDNTSFEKEIETETDSMEVYNVSSLQDFLNSLGNDRIIRMDKTINLSEEIQDLYFNRENISLIKNGDYGLLKFGNEYYSISDGSYYSSAVDSNTDLFEMYLENIYENHLLEIHNCTNLIIEGYKNNTVAFVTNQNEGAVISFQKNTNLSIKNLQFYHSPTADGGCGEYAPVVSFYEDKNLIIDNCSFNGSGTEGIIANNVTNFLVNNSRIFNCSNTGVFLNTVEKFTLQNSNIDNNTLTNSVISIKNSNALIENTNILSNVGSKSRFLYVDENSTIKFKKCKIENNDKFYLDSEQELFFEEDCILQMSDFKDYEDYLDKEKTPIIKDKEQSTNKGLSLAHIPGIIIHKSDNINQNMLKKYNSKLSELYAILPKFSTINFFHLNTSDPLNFIAQDSTYYLPQNKTAEDYKIIFWDGVKKPLPISLSEKRDPFLEFKKYFGVKTKEEILALFGGKKKKPSTKLSNELIFKDITPNHYLHPESLFHIPKNVRYIKTDIYSDGKLIEYYEYFFAKNKKLDSLFSSRSSCKYKVSYNKNGLINFIEKTQLKSKKKTYLFYLMTSDRTIGKYKTDSFDSKTTNNNLEAVFTINNKYEITQTNYPQTWSENYIQYYKFEDNKVDIIKAKSGNYTFILGYGFDKNNKVSKFFFTNEHIELEKDFELLTPKLAKNHVISDKDNEIAFFYDKKGYCSKVISKTNGKINNLITHTYKF
ncbi:right-handed parallel beta-helix repeat-containing protein [Aquimarina muelleri]|uniref:Right handed beta helix domain-containing protein n=1 Tax=Aquimarina muelleri TaxID=279356 RepID=A0A918JW40_9FLAO|nr:right-handed parallel beta-helix repeat-containing protein [Aquimarina muelleri]MCX2762265.1 right-handed parallel beta-helix repeat-containing protein [Aquimarina muelleri]GGX17963.1 hypothetical protein GCM10007384_19280 [Aquimarina muelleri]